MKNAFIFHGTMGSSDGNWFPWLSEQLVKDGYSVDVPTLPTPEGQSLEGWMAAVEGQVEQIRTADVLVGHSLGATFILRLLERFSDEGKVKKALLVSTVSKVIGNEEYDTLNASFIETAKTPFDWTRINAAAQQIQMFHGSDDPYVPLEHAQEVSTSLGAPLSVIDGGGHLNSEFGFLQFFELLDAL